LYYYKEANLNNFGDVLSHHLIERIVGSPVDVYSPKQHKGQKKLLAIGSIFYFASDGDVIWGSGVNGKTLSPTDYRFIDLDIRAVRGPLSRQFLQEHCRVRCPEVYGDPALLFPYFFPEFKKSTNPEYDYLIVPHYTEIGLFSKEQYPNVVFPTDPWEEVVKKIVNSKFVISSSLHGIIVAESFGIPARMLWISENRHKHIFKYQDYYIGTGRPEFRYANTVEEAIALGGERPVQCDLQKLYEAFPFEFWPHAPFPKPKLN
jgi:pyruvyltransferase